MRQTIKMPLELDVSVPKSSNGELDVMAVNEFFKDVVKEAIQFEGYRLGVMCSKIYDVNFDTNYQYEYLSNVEYDNMIVSGAIRMNAEICVEIEAEEHFGQLDAEHLIYEMFRRSPFQSVQTSMAFITTEYDYSELMEDNDDYVIEE